MSDAPDTPTATNDEIYLLLQETQMKAAAIFRKASATSSGGDPGEPTAQEDRSMLDAKSPGATNWAIFHDLKQLDETLGSIETLLDEAL